MAGVGALELVSRRSILSVVNDNEPNDVSNGASTPTAPSYSPQVLRITDDIFIFLLRGRVISMELYDHSPVNYHYNYGDRVSYPHHSHGPRGNPGRFLTSKESQQGSKLYGDGLMQLSRNTETHIERLKEKLAQIDPCYAFGIEHWHADRRQDRGEFGTVELPEEARPKWQDKNVMFGSNADMKRHIHRPPSRGLRDEDGYIQTTSSASTNKFCYLCTTLEEHQQHIARRGRQLKEKHKPKPRICYIAPPPLVKKKKEEVEEKEEVVYKITVRTANKPHADTSANVFIKLRGRKGEMKKRQLKKKLAGNFCFGRGSSETFHIRGPRIGEIRSLIIGHDGLEKKHSWLLDEVEVTNLSTGQKWVFQCRTWLSLFMGDCMLKRELRAEVFETQEVEYAITVVTGDKRFAGTDANVFITLYGKKGVSKKIPLKNKSKNNFERGQKDTFTTVMDDIGPLTRIRIEHDDSGPGSGWLLEKVIIEDTEDTTRRYTFPCGQWLATDEGDGALFKMLFPLGKSKQKVLMAERGRYDEEERDDVARSPQITYEVTVITGNVSYAGTDARVYLQMYGTTGITQDVELDDEKDNFEKGQTDVFKIKANDVGHLKKVKIRHDNSGLGAGWYLEKMIIRRYFSKEEVRERLSQMQDDLEDSVAKRASEVTGEDIPPPSRTGSLKHSGSFRRDKHRRSIRFDGDDDESTSRHLNKYGKVRRGTVTNLESSDSELSSDETGRKARKGRKTKGKTKAMKYGGHTVYVTDTESDLSDEEIQRKQKKRSGKRNDSESEEDNYLAKRASRRTKYDQDSNTKSTVWKKDRIPLCDEYVFPCNRWLARDEDDEQVERILKPKSVTTFYKVNK